MILIAARWEFWCVGGEIWTVVTLPNALLHVIFPG